LVLASSFGFTYLAVPWLIPRLMRAGISGRDMNKPGSVVLPEMGGFAVVGGFLVGVLLAIGLSTFSVIDVGMDLGLVLASVSTILVMALIGVIDDLFLVSQKVKAFLPIFASLPLVAVKAGVTTMTLPIFGDVDFGVFYALVFIPVAITGASNATNMLAGFNGLEAGLGVVMFSTIGGLAYALGRVEAAVLSFALLGSLIAFLRFNWYPARIFIGDVGTLTVGAGVACAVIVGNMEQVGAILILPFFAELYLKARSRFQAQSWCENVKGELVCVKRHQVYGLGRLVMHYLGGASEKQVVLSIVLFEALFAVAAIISYSSVLGL